MTYKNLISIFIGAALLFGCSGNKLIIDSATSKTACTAKTGYWYKYKCWKDFEDEGNGIDKADIDTVVKKQMALIDQSTIKMNKNTYPLCAFYPIEEGRELVLITIFKKEDKYQSIVQEAKQRNIRKQGFNTKAFLFNGNVMEMNDKGSSLEELRNNSIARGKMHVVIHDMEKDDISFSGVLKNDSRETSYDISYRLNEAIMVAGTSTIEIKGGEAYLNGDLGTRTYPQIKDIIDNHPEVKTIVLGDVPGSINDAVNMHTGRILREAGLHTKVLSTSIISSGGVDLFCAGNERIVEKGAKIGIHSWCCYNDLSGADLPIDHPAHQYQIEYFSMCIDKKLGPEFYFHTLTSASADDIHWMSDEDIVKWKVSTKFIDK